MFSHKNCKQNNACHRLGYLRSYVDEHLDLEFDHYSIPDSVRKNFPNIHLNISMNDIRFLKSLPQQSTSDLNAT